jgi:hypothetical protein
MVYEVYFGGTREVHSNNFSDVYGGHGQEMLEKGLALCRRHQVRSNLLCNAWTLFFHDIGASLKLIRALPRLDAVTISDPMAIKTFRQAFPRLDIQASVIMNLDSLEKIEAALAAGVGTIALPTRMNRDAKTLKRVRELKKRFPRLKVKLLANHQCRSECLFSSWHYLIGSAAFFRKGLSCNARFQEEIYGKRSACYDEIPRHLLPRELLKLPFIRPEDIDFYLKNSYADVFKLVYRDFPSDKLRRIYQGYFSRRLEGDLFRFVSVEKYGKSAVCENARFPKGFVRRVTSCDKICQSCSYCDMVARACISGT